MCTFMTCHTLWLYDQSTTSLLQIGLCVAIKDHHCQQVDVYIVRCSPTSPCLSARYQSGLVPSGPTGGTLCSLQASPRQCLTSSFEFFAKLFDDKKLSVSHLYILSLKVIQDLNLPSDPVWSVPSQSQEFSIFLYFLKNHKYQFTMKKNLQTYQKRTNIKIIRIKFLSIWGMSQTSGYV